MMKSSGFMDDEVKRNAAEKFEQATQSVVMNAAKRNISGPKKQKRSTEAPTIRSKKGDLQKRDEEEDEEEDDFDEDKFELDDEEEIIRLRQARLQQIKTQAKMEQEFKNKGHGAYTEITEDQFLKEVTGSKFVVCHFYHRDFERCKIVDKHLNIISVNHISTKFIKINAEKSPFFVQKLQVRMLPTIVCFINGVAKDEIVGFSQLTGSDDFKTHVLEERLREAEVIA
ncbi:thioredoxin domain-containing protein [Acrasis kona]|uniref:Thioredoxin domain-containing protein n=1 Tax=Acrasis kona TaxID=1008807 RepID=A0AAW2Z296_9EUKA